MAEERFGTAAVSRLRAVLERRLPRARVAELEAVRRREADAGALDTLRRLGRAAAYRDDNTAEHTERVARLAAHLARRLGLAERTVWLLRHAAPVHDLGKIAIPDAILLKPARLTADELEVAKSHASLGARVLAGGGSELLETAERVARSHHERWDGTGYPDALAGEAIPVAARLVHVADVFDVLVHERPHKDAWTAEEAARAIRAGAGTQFDPDVVQAFEDLGERAWRDTPEPL
jgi:putative two-component system response regulator